MSDRGQVTYLTNGCAEEVCDFATLEGGEWNYVCDDEIAVTVDLPNIGPTTFHMLMGYSILCDDERFLSPTVEHMFDDALPGDRDRAEVDAKTLLAAVEERFLAVGGSAVIEPGPEDRFTIAFRVPTSYAVSTGLDYEGWLDHLRTELLGVEPAPSAAPTL